jgi:hypothetical protein
VSPTDFNPAFRAAGVPARYLHTKLATLGKPVATLGEYVKGISFLPDFRNGRGVTLTGDDELCEAAIYCLAKSAMVRAISTIVVTPMGLLELLTRSDDEELTETIELLYSAHAIFVPTFNDPHYPKCPFTDHERYKVENFLLSMLNRERSVSVHYVDAATSDWWSTRLMTRLANMNTRFTL